MKVKVVLAALAMVLMASFTSMVWADDSGGPTPETIFQQKLGAAKEMKFSGTVLSHDVTCHCVVLKTAKGNMTLQDDYAKFDGDYNRAKGLKIGSKVSGGYKAIDYINYALEIHNE